MLTKPRQLSDKSELFSNIQQRHLQIHSIITSLITSQDSSIVLPSETIVNILWAVQDLVEDAQEISSKLQESDNM